MRGIGTAPLPLNENMMLSLVYATEQIELPS